jgi:hypothetical protein
LEYTFLIIKNDKEQGIYPGSYLKWKYFKSEFNFWKFKCDHLCGLMVRVIGYRSRGLGSIPGATRFSEK